MIYANDLPKLRRRLHRRMVPTLPLELSRKASLRTLPATQVPWRFHWIPVRGLRRRGQTWRRTLTNAVQD